MAEGWEGPLSSQADLSLYDLFFQLTLLLITKSSRAIYCHVLVCNVHYPEISWLVVGIVRPDNIYHIRMGTELIVTVHTHDKLVVLPDWEIKPLHHIPLSHIILTLN